MGDYTPQPSIDLPLPPGQLKRTALARRDANDSAVHERLHSRA